MRFWLVVLILAITLPAGAHHPFTPYYDASKQEVLTGVIVELKIVNPHVVLIVDVSGPDARKGRWAFEGFPPHFFPGSGVDLKGTLQPGKPITISGWPAKDAARVFSGREVTFPDKSKMLFGPTPEEGDRWHCASGSPCPFKYPEVSSR
jgi:Family of unknown function (DUF6152)